ncbi:unnamed protein product [Closterium sp. Yama58-4]|nr:unnamed protein product [Closterium sp. Yama58-4]
MASVPSQDKFSVGQRVALKEPEKGHHYAPRGTVRYVGPVDGHKGEWVGVEWDDPSRGKHDGVVTGKRYFQCEKVPAGTPAGSFVRPQKLTGGVTLRDALLDRYNTSGEDYKALTELDMSFHLLTDWHEVQRVGEELPGLTALDIGHSRLAFPLAVVSSSPYAGSSRSTPPALSASPLAGLRKLGLSNTRVTWAQVCVWSRFERVGLFSQFPSQTPSRASPLIKLLTHLPLELLQPLLTPRYPISLLQLHIQVEEISRQLPLLETLVLIKNEIASLRPMGGAVASQPPLDCLQHLTYLDLSSNSIADWAQVSFLSALPSLKWLLLSGNQIANIPRVDDKAAHASIFHSLHHLSLADNNLCEWASINALALTCPNLKELVLSHKPYVPRLPSANQTPASTSARANGNTTDGNGSGGGEAANGSLTPGIGGAAAAADDGEEGDGRVERCEFGLGVTEEGRMGVIARIGSIQKLNLAQILPRERTDAEIWYISHAIRSLPHATSLPQLVSAGHPALPALLAKHGLDLVSERRKLLPGFYSNTSTSATLAPGAAGAAVGAAGASSNSGDVTASSNRPSSSSFLSITFRVISPEGSGSSTAKEVTKKLPQSTTVSKMRPLIARLLKLDPRSVSLFLLPSTLEGVQPLPSLLLDNTVPLGVLLHSTTTAALNASQATIVVDTSLDVQQVASLSVPQVLACEQRLARLLEKV